MFALFCGSVFFSRPGSLPAWGRRLQAALSMCVALPTIPEASGFRCGLQILASRCLRNPHGFCRLLSLLQRLFISRVLVATPDDELALFMQTAAINPRVGILSMLRFERLSLVVSTP